MHRLLPFRTHRPKETNISKASCIKIKQNRAAAKQYKIPEKIKVNKNKIEQISAFLYKSFQDITPMKKQEEVKTCRRSSVDEEFCSFKPQVSLQSSVQEDLRASDGTETC